MQAPDLLHPKAIAEAVKFDMVAWWRPSEGFFRRVSKKMSAGAVTVAGCPSATSKAVLAVSKPEATAAALKP